MNHIVLLGRTTKDIELRYAGTNNTAIASFTLAVNRQFKKEVEERQADFISCKVFGKTAENISKLVTKGQQICIGGRIQTGKYDKDGVTHYTTDVIVENFYLCGSKNENQSNSTEPNQTNAPGFFPMGDGDDELPFN